MGPVLEDVLQSLMGILRPVIVPMRNGRSQASDPRRCAPAASGTGSRAAAVSGSGACAPAASGTGSRAATVSGSGVCAPAASGSVERQGYCATDQPKHGFTALELSPPAGAAAARLPLSLMLKRPLLPDQPSSGPASAHMPRARPTCHPLALDKPHFGYVFGHIG